MSDVEAIVRWYLALTAMSLLVAPIVAWLGSGLGSARFGLVRPAGMAIATALVWWPAVAFGLPFTRTTLVVFLGLVGIAGWFWWARRGFVGISWSTWLTFEMVWLLAFVAFAFVRGYNPDIANTEKPMEIALLSSVSRSSEVPAPDPWLAGFPINYYYFGYQSIAALVKLSGVPPTIAFNLALATLFASCAAAAAAIALVLAHASGERRGLQIVAAALGPAVLLLAANWETARRMVLDIERTTDAGWWDGVGWQASRIIVDVGVHGNPSPRQTINEFPAFSFVLGDLHPHVLTYPLLACILALAIGIALSETALSPISLAATGGLAGLLYASNSWDAPAGVLFLAGGIAIAQWGNMRAMAKSIGLIAAGALLAAAPFLLTFTAPVGVANADLPDWLAGMPVLGTLFSTFGIVDWRPSSARELLIVHGPWIVAWVAWFVRELRRNSLARSELAQRRDALLVGGTVTLALAVIWMPALVWIGWPIAGALWIAATTGDRATRVVAALFFAGFGLVLLPEFVYIQDVFADRMNTVFKLYFQAWLVLSVAAVAAVVQIAVGMTRRWRPVLLAGTLVWLLAALPYTPISAWDWYSAFDQRHGLDGSAYIARYSPDDAALITYIQQHAEPGDVIVEAPGCSYGSFAGVPLSRVSAFTGVPTLLGWHGHETQWRRGEEDVLALVTTRLSDNRIPRSADANDILSALATQTEDGVDPRFLVLGTQELEENSGCSLSVARPATVADALQDLGWEVAFESGDARIFVREDDLIGRGDVVSGLGRR